MRVLLVDNDIKSIDEIKKVIVGADAQVELKIYYHLSELDEEYKGLIQEELTEFFKFNICIFNFNELKFEKWKSYLETIRAHIPKESSICFTSHDNINVTYSRFHEIGIFNIFYKPFDALILKESIHMALKPQKKTETVEIKAQAAKAFVAILKEIELASISEIGFVTINEGEIPIKSISKYFSPIFSYGRKQSVWAQCMASIPIPNKPGFFVNKFQYIGIQPGALKDLRGFIQKNKANKTDSAVWNLSQPKNSRSLLFALVNADENTKKNMKADLQAQFENLVVEFVDIDFANKPEINSKPFDAVICFSDSIKYDDLKKRFREESVFILVSLKQLEEDTIKSEAENYKDIFISPVDKSYFYKKLKTHFADLKSKEDYHLTNITSSEKFKASNLVKISEICELYVNFTYHRELPFGTFREFIFVAEDENQVIELPAFCNFSEKSKSEANSKTAAFFHQFLFWGMKDHYLKQIRIWLLHNHILSQKDKFE